MFSRPLIVFLFLFQLHYLVAPHLPPHSLINLFYFFSVHLGPQNAPPLCHDPWPWPLSPGLVSARLAPVLAVRPPMEPITSDPLCLLCLLSSHQLSNSPLHTSPAPFPSVASALPSSSGSKGLSLVWNGYTEGTSRRAGKLSSEAIWGFCLDMPPCQSLPGRAAPLLHQYFLSLPLFPKFAEHYSPFNSC